MPISGLCSGLISGMPEGTYVSGLPEYKFLLRLAGVPGPACNSLLRLAGVHLAPTDRAQSDKFLGTRDCGARQCILRAWADCSFWFCFGARYLFVLCKVL